MSGSAAIRTADLDGTVAWYRDTLGFRKVGDRATTQGRYALLERDGFLLEVREDDHDVPSPPAGNSTVGNSPARDVEATGSLWGVALRMIVSDVDAEVERLRARSVEVVAGPDDDETSRFRIALIRDNDGRTIQLREPVDTEAFHPEGR